MSTTRPSFSGYVVVNAVLRAIYGIHNVQGLTMYCCGLSGFDDSLKWIIQPNHRSIRQSFKGPGRISHGRCPLACQCLYKIRSVLDVLAHLVLGIGSIHLKLCINIKIIRAMK